MRFNVVCYTWIPSILPLSLSCVLLYCVTQGSSSWMSRTHCVVSCNRLPVLTECLDFAHAPNDSDVSLNLSSRQQKLNRCVSESVYHC